MPHRYVQPVQNGVFVAGSRGVTITDIRYFSDNTSGTASCEVQIVTSVTGGTVLSSPSLDASAPTPLTTFVDSPTGYTTGSESLLFNAVGAGPQSDVAVIRQPIKIPPGEQLFVGAYPAGSVQAIVYFEE